jgi:hypothetical protein
VAGSTLLTAIDCGWLHRADARLRPHTDEARQAVAGEPQCFLSETQLIEELGVVGFEKDPPGPLTEYNRLVKR